jgi:anti-sigma B factor antagonist
MAVREIAWQDSQMTFEIHDEQIAPGVWVFRLGGQFDFSQVALARAAVNKRIEEKPSLIVVNLDGLDYIDSAGLGVLVGTLARLREYGGSFGVVVHTPRIRRVFDITKLTQLMPVYDTAEEAFRHNAVPVA